MIVFWQGYGFLALLVGLLPIGAHFALSYPQPRPTSVPVGLACFAAAGVCLAAGRRFRHLPGRHTLYFLPVSVWAGVYAALGVYCLGVGGGLWGR